MCDVLRFKLKMLMATVHPAYMAPPLPPQIERLPFPKTTASQSTPCARGVSSTKSLSHATVENEIAWWAMQGA